ncbi:MAG: hypothetical protein ACRD28_02530 [Acidobacteriaceae bacterium]
MTSAQKVRTNIGTRRRRKIILVILSCVGIALVAFLVAADYAARHAEPILRARVVQALSTRFDSQVKLGKFHISFGRGFGVEGDDLTLRSNLDPSLPPQIQIDRFAFHAGLLDLFRSPMRVGVVRIHGLVLRIPPKGQRPVMPKPKKHHRLASVFIDKIVCDDATLTIMTDKPGKLPLQFVIRDLTLKRVGNNVPMHFEAHLINPKPIGAIASSGNFGPWDADDPSSTPVDGTYSFTHADLSTTHGIAGMLSSKGKFSGQLDKIDVDGTTDTPDFSVDVSGNRVHLTTEFHAIVNGTNGNTYLQPVKAHFLHTDITATGDVVRDPKHSGHDIDLDVSVDKGRIEDLLLLGVKTDPPVMSGNVQLKTKFHLPPGKEPVTRKLQLKGHFAIENVLFSNDKIQKKMDQLSLRSQGKPGEAKKMDDQKGVLLPGQSDVHANMHGVFSLANGKLHLPQLVCNVPGAEIQLAGVYTLDGKQFDFTGHARMQASLSGIVGGWKGMLLKPFDRYFSKDGAGTEIPIKITGTKGDPHFGLNY